MGPYFWTLFWSHCSAVLARMARRRLKLWPIMGIPSDPGGVRLDDDDLGVLVLVMRMSGMMRRRIRRRKVVMRMFIVVVDFEILVLERGRGGGI